MLRREFLAWAAAPAIGAAPSLSVATFEVDITPPLKTPLCIGLVMPGERVDDPLYARGVVLKAGKQPPVVLCALDWLGIGNASYDGWRVALAKAARTVPSRVALHTVHQHDAPGSDDSAQQYLRELGLDNTLQSDAYVAATLARLTAAVRRAKPRRITHVSAGSAVVRDIASNRRILTPDGKFLFQRLTSCRNSPHCDAPVGTIDPELKSVSFWSNEARVATLSYYATHPMSHYGKGAISADFPGLARREQTDTFQVYFTGAAGNIGAGKFNTGAPENRARLAERLAAAMREAKANEKKLDAEPLRWTVVPVVLPHRQGADYSEEAIRATLNNPKLEPRPRANAARYLAWYERCRRRHAIELSALHLGPLHIVHMPGELFVEYQLAAAREKPNELVAMAAYGDYGPMYIGTAKAYAEGGYETSQVSRVGPEVEDILMSAMRKLLAPS
jgi:hypothetical protein